MRVVSMIDSIDDDVVKVPIKKRLRVEALVVDIMNLDIDEYDEIVNALYGIDSYNYDPKKLDLDLKNRATPPVRPSIEEPSIWELKALLYYLWYAFLWDDNNLPVIIPTDLVET